MTQILSYFDQDNTHEQYNLAQPWFDASNADAVSHRISVGVPFKSRPAYLHGHRPRLRGPERKSVDDLHGREHRLFCHFRRIVNDDREGAKHDSAGVFLCLPQRPCQARIFPAHFGPQSTTTVAHRFAEITDGLSNTVMISEMSGRPWLYLAGGQQVPAANFPSYVSAGSEDADGRYPVQLRLGSLGS